MAEDFTHADKRCGVQIKESGAGERVKSLTGRGVKFIKETPLPEETGIAFKMIERISLNEILESRGNPTVEAQITCNLNRYVHIRASAPAGASTGSREMTVRADEDTNYFQGQGCAILARSVKLVFKDLLKILKEDSSDSNKDGLSCFKTDTEFILKAQNGFDALLCALNGPDNLIGSSITISLSIAFFKLLAFINEHKTTEQDRTSRYSGPLAIPSLISDILAVPQLKTPLIFFNVINGGKHSAAPLSIQEFLVAFPANDTPTAPSTPTPPPIRSQLSRAHTFMISLSKVLAQRFPSTCLGIGDEGGFAPPARTTEEALNTLRQATQESPPTPTVFGLDVAASTLLSHNTHHPPAYNIDGHAFSSQELLSHFSSLLSDFPELTSVEDPFDEDDTHGWQAFYKSFGGRIRVVADDLTTTDAAQITKFSVRSGQLFNTVLIKPNQISTLSATFQAIKAARSHACQIMISHRSAETGDAFVAALAVGAGAEAVKFGALRRGERIAKFNELLRIEEALEELNEGL